MSDDNMTKVSHVEIYHKLGILEGKLDSLVGFERRVQGDLSSLDTRITSVEQWRWFVLGSSAAVAVGASVLFSILQVPV